MNEKDIKTWNKLKKICLKNGYFLIGDLGCWVLYYKSDEVANYFDNTLEEIYEFVKKNKYYELSNVVSKYCFTIVSLLFVIILTNAIVFKNLTISYCAIITQWLLILIQTIIVEVQKHNMKVQTANYEKIRIKKQQDQN